MSIIKSLLSTTRKLRENHEKRSDPRNFINSYDSAITLPDMSDSLKISIGYLERFLLKADNNGIDDGGNTGSLTIDEWTEGCGFFSGKYTMNINKETRRTGSFKWEGQGKIEDTWNLFSVFE